MPLLTAFGVAVLLGTAGCQSDLGNMAIGAGAAGAAYEYSNEQQLDELEKQRDAGEISQEEYERRTQDIEDRSIVN
jgi:membrane-bound lytic murein transglycosylase B